jgi:hypothetical protein
MSISALFDLDCNPCRTDNPFLRALHGYRGGWPLRDQRFAHSNTDATAILGANKSRDLPARAKAPLGVKPRIAALLLNKWTTCFGAACNSSVRPTYLDAVAMVIVELPAICASVLFCGG